MTRTGVWTEVAVSPAALLLVMVAALWQAPGLLTLLALLWFLPQVVRLGSGSAGLDEREARLESRAERISLSLLLVLVCALPAVLTAGGQDTVQELRQEWGDVGFLVLGVFYLRSAVLVVGAMAPAFAAQVTGGLALLTAWVLAWGTWWLRGDDFLALGLLAPVVCLVPHAVALVSPNVAAGLWLAGAGLTTAMALFSGFVPIESLVIILVLALPWALAGWFASRA